MNKTPATIAITTTMQRTIMSSIFGLLPGGERRLDVDSSLVVRKAGETRRVLVASPDYLERHGVPSIPRISVRTT